MVESSQASSLGGGEPDIDLEYLEEYDASRGVPFETHLLAGSGAGLAEHCVVFPLDTIKTNAQCVGACGRTRAPDVVCVRAAKRLIGEGVVTGEGGMRLSAGPASRFEKGAAGRRARAAGAGGAASAR